MYLAYAFFDIVNNNSTFAGPLLFEKFMSGRLLLCWRHKLTYTVMRKRYLQSLDVQKQFHTDVANIFFSEFANSDPDDGESKNGEKEEKTSKSKKRSSHKITYAGSLIRLFIRRPCSGSRKTNAIPIEFIDKRRTIQFTTRRRIVDTFTKSG